MPNPNEILADHFLKAAGISAVYVDAGGAIGAADTAGMFCPHDRIMLCCTRGNHTKVATLAAARVPAKAAQAAALAAVREAAAKMGIGPTPHETVIRRGICDR